jgi:hypothetical protein
MALVHTIQIQTSNPAHATRKSENRRYTACLVVTVTEASVRVNADRKAKAEAELVDWTAKLAARLAQHGMTHEQAEVWEKDASDRWYGRWTARRARDIVVGKGFDGPYWEAVDQARKELNRICNDDQVTKRAHAIMVAQGFADPFDYAKNPSGIVEAAGKVEHLTDTLAAWKVPVPGTQWVYSWHGSVGLAQKAVGPLDHTRADGHRIDVRTDIAVRETAKRAPKAAS